MSLPRRDRSVRRRDVVFAPQNFEIVTMTFLGFNARAAARARWRRRPTSFARRRAIACSRCSVNSSRRAEACSRASPSTDATHVSGRGC